MPAWLSTRLSITTMSFISTTFIALATCAAILIAAGSATLTWAVLAFIPGINIVAIPSLIGSVLVLVHVLPFGAYLLLAQTDAPKHSGSFFLPFSAARHLGLMVAVVHYVYYVSTTIPRLVLAVARTSLRMRNAAKVNSDSSYGAADSSDSSYPSAWWERYAQFGIPYRTTTTANGVKLVRKLDVYMPPPWASSSTLRSDLRMGGIGADGESPRGYASPPLSQVSSQQTLPDVDSGSRLALHNSDDFEPSVWTGSAIVSEPRSPQPNLKPVIVFLYDVGIMGPIRPSRWMFSLTGSKLSEQGYVTVIPDITAYPAGQAKDMVADTRSALAWVYKEIKSFGGDPDNIYICGHGLGAHLGMYTLAQDAIVRSRDHLEIHNAASQWPHLRNPSSGASYGASPKANETHEIPNGLRTLRIYASDVDLPEIKGIILLSPVADVIKQVRHEAKLWLEHVSPLRRALGSSQTRCMRHSLGHILFAARELVDVDRLPEHVLIIHGNDDQLVPAWQSVWLADLLNGLSVPTKFRQYAGAAHFDIAVGLMSGMENLHSDRLVYDICSFIEQC